MGIPAKRRMEILDEIARLGKQQKKTPRGIVSTGRRSPKGDLVALWEAYEQRRAEREVA